MNSQKSQSGHSSEELHIVSEAMQSLNEEEQAHVVGGTARPSIHLDCINKYHPILQREEYMVCVQRANNCVGHIGNEVVYNRCLEAS
jgi:hypothetical protein